MNDWELLNEYVRDGSQEAFASLVSVHLNLVYSAARRQVGSAALAEEVAQVVFIELARSAPRLRPTASLASWLHTVTRHAAIKAVRGESRRRMREQAGFELSAMNAPPSDWKQIEPLLDEAVASLSEADRSAVLLRFFENRSLREIGAALGASEDAAQKRVSRALEQLRSYFRKRGLALGSGALATNLSAHAIQVAPATLGAAIAAGSAGAALPGIGLALETSRILAMTTFQKTALGTFLALALGAGLYEASLLRGQSRELQLQREALERARTQLVDLRREAGETTRDLASARLQLAAPPRLDPALAADIVEALRAWQGRERLLRQTLADNPQWDVPELRLLTEKDWTAATETASLDTPAQVRAALGALRRTAASSLVGPGSNALKAYAAAHGGNLPETPAQLAPFFSPAIDPAILARLELLRTGKLFEETTAAGGPGARPVLANRQVVDYEYDAVIAFGPTPSGQPVTSVGGHLAHWTTLAMEAYAKANEGRRFTDRSQLLPFLPAGAPAAVAEELSRPLPARAP